MHNNLKGTGRLLASRSKLIGAAAVISIGGLGLLYTFTSGAATYATGKEAESGNLTAQAKTITDSGASGGNWLPLSNKVRTSGTWQ